MRNGLHLSLLLVLGVATVSCSSAGVPTSIAQGAETQPTGSRKNTTTATLTAQPVVAASGNGSQKTQERLRGFFLQVPGEQDASLWTSSIHDIAALDADTVIIQTESYVNKAGERNAVARVNLTAALEEARSRKLKVHIGLALLSKGNGNPKHAADPTWIAALIDASEKSFTLLWDEYQPYAKSGTWTGVYLPEELWTPADPADLGQLPKYVKQLSHLVKTKSNLNVSMSPLISGQANNDTKATRTAFTSLFQSPDEATRAEVDVVMLQDGIGQRGLGGADVAAQLPFYRAMKDACGTRCDVWANVESFAYETISPRQTERGSSPPRNDVSGQRVPAPWERFRTQMKTLLPIAPNQVSFEYSQYWNAKVPAGANGQTLHDSYKVWLDGR